MLGWTRLKALLRMLGYPAAWTLPPRVWRAVLRFGPVLRPVGSPVGTVLHLYAPPIGGQGFRRYLQGLKRLARGQRVPLVVHLSVTDRCAYRCARCSNLGTSQADPPAKAIRALIEQLRRAGTASIAFTGGEPALRDDLCELVAACRHDISTILFTSGQRIDGKVAAALRAAGLELAFVSLDHYRPEEHDRIRGQPGAFRQAVAAIEACLGAGLYTAVQAVVEPPLLHAGEMSQYLEFCRTLGVYEVMLLEPVPVRSTPSCPGLSEADRRRLSELHRRSARDNRGLKVSSMSLLEHPELLGCQAGFTFFYVDSSGDVFPCDFAPLAIGNVYQAGVPAILARLAEQIPGPSRRCLAACLSGQIGFQSPRPLRDEMAAKFLAEHRPDGHPGMMDWLPRP